MLVFLNQCNNVCKNDFTDVLGAFYSNGTIYFKMVLRTIYACVFMRQKVFKKGFR